MASKYEVWVRSGVRAIDGTYSVEFAKSTTEDDDEIDTGMALAMLGCMRAIQQAAYCEQLFREFFEWAIISHRELMYEIVDDDKEWKKQNADPRPNQNIHESTGSDAAAQP